MTDTSLTIHAVPNDSGGVVAICGQLLGDGHTGHFPASVRYAIEADGPVCPACAKAVRR